MYSLMKLTKHFQSHSKLYTVTHNNTVVPLNFSSHVAKKKNKRKKERIKRKEKKNMQTTMGFAYA